ncbi:hypothetical protein G3T14_17645 [Methylobacterium sp. BTF04]|uniref:hypothetical protein n=1 Tax=Methylobacterium sp. BTF04 TaxID=2708300 RepID=UPI0013D76962|nr:hypothetical protein [Methylobacterium sp. BTF04]NEU13938.1 hypothetical protein [Methylobacterium sp. BTF04]
MSQSSFKKSIANKLDELQYVLTPLRIAQADLMSQNWISNEKLKPGGKVDVIAFILTILKYGKVVHAVWDAPDTIMQNRAMLLKGEAEFQHHHLVVKATTPREDEYTLRVPDEETAKVLKYLFVDKRLPVPGLALTVALCVDRPAAGDTTTRDVFSKTVSANWEAGRIEVH